MVAMAIAAVAAVNVHFANGSKGGQSALKFANVEALANGESGGGSSSCRAGGPGSSNCSIKTEQLQTSRECSVTCNSGYYACCNITLLLSAECNCVSE